MNNGDAKAEETQEGVSARLREKSAKVSELLRLTEVREAQTRDFVDRLAAKLERRWAAVAMETDKLRMKRESVRAAAEVQTDSVQDLPDAEAVLDGALAVQGDWAVKLMWDEAEAEAIARRILSALVLTAGISSSDAVSVAANTSGQAVSAACLSGERFVIELPSRAVRVYDSAGEKIRDLTVTNADGSAVAMRPYRVRVCSALQRVIIVDKAASVVTVCQSDGRLCFNVGPKFSDAHQLGTPEDAVSTGRLLVICSPEYAIYMVSLTKPTAWRTTLKNDSLGLARPVGLGWSACWKCLVVVSQSASDDDSYVVSSFRISTNKTAAVLNSVTPRATVHSLARPAVLSYGGRILVSLRSSEGPEIACMSVDTLEFIRTLRLPSSVCGGVTDMCWIGQRLSVCCQGQFLFVNDSPDIDPDQSSGESTEQCSWRRPAPPSFLSDQPLAATDCDPQPDMPQPVVTSSGQAVSAACLSCERFVLELPSGAVRVHDSRGDWTRDLTLFDAAGCIVDAHPHRIRVCSELGLLIIVEKIASSVTVCRPDGGVCFTVGPKFSCSVGCITNPEDAVSTGTLLVICCPEYGLLFSSIANPTGWKTSIQNAMSKLKGPVRLAWSSQLGLLIVVDEIRPDQYRVHAVEIETKTIAVALRPRGRTNGAFQSLTRPCVLVSREGILVATCDLQDCPKIACLSIDCASVIRIVRLPAGCPVTDMCWIDQRLGVCCDQYGLCIPANSAGLHPEKRASSSEDLSSVGSAADSAAAKAPARQQSGWSARANGSVSSRPVSAASNRSSQAAPAAGDSPGQAVSAACLSCERFVLELPSRAVRVYDSRGDWTRDFALTDHSGFAVQLHPHCVRVSKEHNLVIIVDRYASIVQLCTPDGRVKFAVGPQFSCRLTLAEPVDAISAGDLLVICSPEFGLYVTSMKSTKWKAPVAKHHNQLTRPVRLAWSGSRRLLIVVDEVAKRRYSVCAFTISTGPTTAVLRPQAPPSSPVESLTAPCVLSGRDGILLAVQRPDGPQVLSVSPDCSFVRPLGRQLPQGSGPVTDMCWLGLQLGLCCDGRCFAMEEATD